MPPETRVYTLRQIGGAFRRVYALKKTDSKLENRKLAFDLVDGNRHCFHTRLVFSSDSAELRLTHRGKTMFAFRMRKGVSADS